MFAVVSVITIFGISLGLTIPLIALVLDSQGYTPSAIGFHASIQFLGIMLASLVTPKLLKVLGTSRLIIISMILMSCIFVSFAMSLGFMPWLFLRFFMGVIEGVIFIAAETWINQIAPHSKRGRAIGIYGTFLAGGIALGPLLLEITDIFNGNAFFLGAAISILCLLILLVSGETPPRILDQKKRSEWKITKTIPIAIMSTMVFGFLDAASFGLLPVYGVVLGFSPIPAAQLVSVLVLGGVVFQYPLGLLSDHIKRQHVLLGCAAAATLCLISVPIMSEISLLVHLLIFIAGGMIGGLWTIPLIIFGENYTGEDLVTVNSMAAILYGFGSILGPSLAGLSMGTSSHGLMLTMAASSSLLVFSGLLIYWRSKTAA